MPDSIPRLLDRLKRNAWRFTPMALLDRWLDRRFDARHGTDTATDVRLQGLTIASPHRQRGNRYHATPPRALQRVLARLRIEPSRFTFVDYGSGKGRTLLIASDLGFARVIGVEFAEELHRCALANLQAWRGGRLRTPVECVQADATEFALPPGPLVLYFFKPFDGVVLAQVLARVRDAAAARPEPVLVVFLYLDEHRPVFDAVGGFVHRFSWRMFDVFDVKPAAG